MGDDARAIADEFGLSPAAVAAYLQRLAIALAADPDADPDEVVLRFGNESRAFETRYFDSVSRYTGYREELREAVAREAHTLIREAAGGEEPRRVAYRLNGRRGSKAA